MNDLTPAASECYTTSCKMVDTISRCPNIACPAVYIPPECRLHTFLIYNGYVCRACDQDVCRFG
ncbi:hypothetical protein ACJMK2_043232 [Sinanodonta woodiana]|uniref:Uncharacterized protein n=1 Tax=Sinanodonta woodiana TaxID=1069815 RepID=A0ABD3VW98_SINWO